MMNKKFLALLIAFFLLLGCAKKEAHVEISDAWTRATQEGQDVGAAYMTLKSNVDLTLTSVESEFCEDIEIHSMSMENGVMKMRMLDELALKADTPVSLSPGGFHLMLFDLEGPLRAGTEVRYTLHFKDKQGKELIVDVNSPVKAE